MSTDVDRLRDQAIELADFLARKNIWTNTPDGDWLTIEMITALLELCGISGWQRSRLPISKHAWDEGTMADIAAELVGLGFAVVTRPAGDLWGCVPLTEEARRFADAGRKEGGCPDGPAVEVLCAVDVRLPESLGPSPELWRTVAVTPMQPGWVNIMDYSAGSEDLAPDERRSTDLEPCPAMLTQDHPDGRQRIVAASIDGDGHLVAAVDSRFYRGTVDRDRFGGA